MGNRHTIYLRRMHGRNSTGGYHLIKVEHHFFQSSPGWAPALDAYRCHCCVLICMELAGVDKDMIEIDLVGRRLTVSGVRPAPEPDQAEGKPLQVLAMEIDHGRFEREIVLPADVDAARVEAEQRNGMLWITLPLQPQT